MTRTRPRPRRRISHRKIGLAVGVAAALCLTGSPVWSQTSPISGAVSKPAGFDISLPFLSGENVYLLSGYSPSGGSSLHDGTDRTCCANDYYALDLILPDHTDSGLGQPVLAIASGTVRKAGWASEGWANYGQRVYIEHDFNSDGHKYISMYAHMNAISVSEGQHVEKGEEIGTLGGSCQMQLSCGSFSTPHVHFALHQDSSIGGSGTGGSYGGHAVVPEPIDGYTFLEQGQTLVSANDGQPAAPCAVISATMPTVLDERGPCFRRLGTASYWTEVNIGYDNTAIYTYTVDSAVDNHGYWMLHFEQAGDYDVEVYIPSDHGLSEQAPYTVRANGNEQTVTRDQTSVSDGWLSLGQFTFAEGGDQWVHLIDDTGEPYDGTRTIVFDAVRISPASGGNCVCSAGDPPQTEACGTCGMRSRSCDGCNWTAWSACMGDTNCGGDTSVTSDTSSMDTADVSGPGDTAGPTDTTTASDMTGSDGSTTNPPIPDTQSGSDVGADAGVDGGDAQQGGDLSAGGGCCATVSRSSDDAGPWALLPLLGVLWWRRRRQSS